MSTESDEYEITDWNYIMSVIGNAYFSGITFGQLWVTVTLTDNREDFDVAVSSLIKLNEVLEQNNE